jgi:photosystem II stability/assembly factor-like uncharacterized protein
MKSKLILIFFCLSFFLYQYAPAQTQKFWEQTNGPYDLTNSYVPIISTVVDSSGRIYAGTNGGIYRSSDNGSTWSNVYARGICYSFTIGKKGRLYAGISDGLFPGGILILSDQDEWSKVGYTFNDVVTVGVSSDNELFAGVDQGAFHSIDSGSTWTKVFPGHTDTAVVVIGINSNGHIFISTNGASRIYKSIDDGQSWQGLNKGLGDYRISSISFNAAGDIFAVGGPDVFRSTDDGNNWTTIDSGLSNAYLGPLAINPLGYLFICTDRGVFRSNNNGDTWVPINEGLSDSTHVISLSCGENGIIVAGTQNLGIFRSIKSTSDVRQISVITASLGLKQNYPNPFNYSTTIPFTIPKPSFVSIKVYDVLGNEIVVLTNKVYAPGKYEVQFDGSGLPEGMYYCKLESEGYSESRKLVHIK